jgi:hypothetical protein
LKSKIRLKAENAAFRDERFERMMSESRFEADVTETCRRGRGRLGYPRGEDEVVDVHPGLIRTCLHCCRPIAS